jgi:hypothetical protein
VGEDAGDVHEVAAPEVGEAVALDDVGEISKELLIGELSTRGLSRY